MYDVFDTPLFAQLSRRERTIARRLGTEVHLLDGHEVTHQGEPGRQFGVVLDGTLRVLRDGQEVARLHAGDCFGEISLLAGRLVPQTATVEAAGNTTVLAFSRSEFAQLLDTVPSFAAKVHLVGLRRLAHAAA
jgi:CRP-like cAMP-binding protein